MVFGEDGEGLVGFILADEETRGLGDPPHAAQLNDGRDGLDKRD